MRKFFLGAIALFLIPFVSPAAILVPDTTGDILLVMVPHPVNPDWGFNGETVLEVHDPGVVGSVHLRSDGLHLILFNLSFTEAGRILFSNPRAGGSGLLMDGIYEPGTTSLTDPALIAAVDGSPYVFDFTFIADLGTTQFYSLAGAASAIPEPGTFLLCGLGIAVVAVRRRLSASLMKVR